ncbi:YcnI family protein [Frigidibacter sp. MR17.14]
MKIATKLPVLALLSSAPLPAMAHVHAQTSGATPGATIEIALEVGHGCAGAATTGLRVALPEGIAEARALPIAGWQATAGPREVGWTGGPLPDGTRQRFVLSATLSTSAAGTLTLPVVQDCGQTSLRWIDADPAAETPAPTISVLPAK